MNTPLRPAPSVEIDQLDGAIWRRSSRSGTHGNCVEVARNLPGIVALRDSKDPTGPKLIVALTIWSGFVAAVRSDL